MAAMVIAIKNAMHVKMATYLSLIKMSVEVECAVILVVLSTVNYTTITSLPIDVYVSGCLMIIILYIDCGTGKYSLDGFSCTDMVFASI